jgi:hypothetical protein
MSEKSVSLCSDNDQPLKEVVDNKKSQVSKKLNLIDQDLKKLKIT